VVEGLSMETISSPRLALLGLKQQSKEVKDLEGICTEAEDNVKDICTEAEAEDNVTEMLGRLNLTVEEATPVILDDENEEDLVHLNWALIGKVLSPTVLHTQTIMAALRPAWGNPKGMNAKPVGDNTFIVEFATKADKDRVMAGTPWTVGKHVVILNDFDARQKPSDVFFFDKLTIWAQIKNLRFELMNKHWAESLGSKLGKVEKVDVDSDNRAWGNFLRVRVTINITKPLMKVITAYSMKYKKYEKYDVRYERLPYYCFSCGLIGHSSMECPTRGERDEEGKLPWCAEKVCAKEEKRRSSTAFVSNSGQSSHSSGRSTHCDDKRVDVHAPTDMKSNEKKPVGAEGQGEINSPLKQKQRDHDQSGVNCFVQGSAMKDPIITKPTAACVVGQKRKQTKVVYRPKGQTAINGVNTTQETQSQAIVIGGNNLCTGGPMQVLDPSNEGDSDSNKKQRKEITLIVTGSADQAEAAHEQPRHTQ
jgi:hypothetical protein